MKIEKLVESWEYLDPKPGDQIRVHLDIIYHHGIYVGNDEVIHFGEGNVSNIQEMKEAEIHKTSLSTFLKGGILEVRDYSKKELKLKLPALEVVKRAYQKLGEKGYNIIHNNCEHFSNYCAFDAPYSKQIDKIRSDVLRIIK